jgi:hypothetical protein
MLEHHSNYETKIINKKGIIFYYIAFVFVKPEPPFSFFFEQVELIVALVNLTIWFSLILILVGKLYCFAYKILAFLVKCEL